MRVLLVSTYELGRQPLHVASPAAALEREGHSVAVVDAAVDELTPAHLDDADAVAISVPMHTATRLALGIAEEAWARRPELPLAIYGLYAGVPSATSGGPELTRIEGEYEPGLVDWVASLAGDHAGPARTVTHTGRSRFEVPHRGGLPSLDRYARLQQRGESVLAGATEASHGCRHRCRHCPIPKLYDGRMRVVPKDVVLADIDQLVAAGARHVSFGDPDFLNAPRHSLDVLAAAHEAHPRVTFDATVKVEHILRHTPRWPELAAMNLLFVVSAFESVDDRTLELLDKGHTVADMGKAVDVLGSAGIHIRPTWLPFLPWTESAHVADTFRFIDRHRLTAATDPVQMSIKLLIPRGSLLERHPAVTPHLDHYDEAALTWRWRFADPDVGLLQKELESIAAAGSDCDQEGVATLEEMRRAVERVTGETLAPVPTDAPAVPRLTESWFCCSEPTGSQLLSVGLRR